MPHVGTVCQPVIDKKAAINREDNQKDVEKKLEAGGHQELLINGERARRHVIIVA
jgi:hypothetical protein